MTNAYIADGMTYNDALDFLSHYGVLGMKWGIRNDDTLRKYGILMNGSSSGNEKVVKSDRVYKKINPEFDKLDSDKSIEENVKLANLGGTLAASFKQDRDNNCAYCTTAYLLRAKGYDVSARSSFRGITNTEISNIFDNTKVEQIITHGEAIKIKQRYGFHEIVHPISKSQYADMESKIVSTQGDGASGYITGKYAGMNTGHAMAYTVSNGRLHIIDGQSGKVYANGFKSPLKEMDSVSIVRTDTAKVNEYKARKYVGSTSLIKAIDNKVDVGKVISRGGAIVAGAALASSKIAASVTATTIGNPALIITAASAIPVANLLTVVGSGVALGGYTASKISSVVRERNSNISKQTNNKTYENAATRYIKEHPNTNFSYSELVAKYKKENEGM